MFFSTKYVIPKSLKVSHWLSELVMSHPPIFGLVACNEKTPNQAGQQTTGENHPIDVLDIEFDPG